MKTVLMIEIETPDAKDSTVTPEEGSTEDDYTTEELTTFREQYTKELHESIVKLVSDVLRIEEDFIDNLEELYVDGWCDFEDYGIKIKVTKQNGKP